jgi:hypothetical protein
MRSSTGHPLNREITVVKDTFIVPQAKPFRGMGSQNAMVIQANPLP